MTRIIAIVIFLLIALNACQRVSESKPSEVPKSLSDFQITACNTAHEAKTCDTRLQEIGIVLKEDCCKNLGKCC